MSNSDAASEINAKSIDESLIDLVRVNPLLFEKAKRLKPYESMKERHEMWRSIGTSLRLEPNFCIARWKHLRDRYRREVAKKHSRATEKKQSPSDDSDDWPLMKKMRFLDRFHLHHHHHHNYKVPEGSQQVSSSASVLRAPNPAVAEQIFGGTNYEEPLQEAMDEQPLLPAEATRRNVVTPAISTQNESSISTTFTNPVLVRIEALLGGLDQTNRNLAEKRILSYLCKCQLQMLEGESIENVQF